MTRTLTRHAFAGLRQLRHCRVRPMAAAAGLSLLALGAQAQLRAPTESYVGLSLGQSQLHPACAAGFDCSRHDTAYTFTLGRTMSPYYGVELGLTDFGHMQRGGGDTKAQAANFSLVGRYPIGAFGVFGKVGASYGRTHTSADALSGLTSGTARGWGGSYGAGVSYDLNPNWTVVAEWSRQQLRFAGEGRQDVDNTSVGVNFRF